MTKPLHVQNGNFTYAEWLLLAVSCLMPCDERRENLAEVIAITRRWFADRDALSP